MIRVQNPPTELVSTVRLLGLACCHRRTARHQVWRGYQWDPDRDNRPEWYDLSMTALFRGSDSLPPRRSPQGTGHNDARKATFGTRCSARHGGDLPASWSADLL